MFIFRIASYEEMYLKAIDYEGKGLTAVCLKRASGITLDAHKKTHPHTLVPHSPHAHTHTPTYRERRSLKAWLDE